tara:strand:- start:3997 stop:4839 length:843 start_codon:yes stop_codon:yes gene_type:complete
MQPNGLAELALREHIRVPEPKPTADGSFLRISSITTCDRKQILDGMQVPTVNVGFNALNGFVAREIGNMLHGEIQQAFSTHPDIYDFEAEVPVSIPTCMTSGHTDGTYLAESGERLVLEIKTMRNYGFRKARKEGPKEEHLMQACAYAIALDIHYIHLVYVCTDATPSRWKDLARAGDMCEWVYNIHDAIEDSGDAPLSVVTTYFLEQHRDMAKEFLDTGVLPEGLTRHWTTSDDDLPWECKYCSHFDICLTEENPLTRDVVIGIKEHYETVIQTSDPVS